MTNADLRTRIAAVLYHRWWESSMSLNEPPRWNQLSQSARDKWLQDADAVIRELRLHVVTVGDFQTVIKGSYPKPLEES